MYHHATSNPLSRLRFFVVCAVLLLGAVKAGYGQDQARTYANFQGNLQTGLKVLGGSLIIGEIDNASRAVDQNPRNASTLRIGAGLLGLASSTQFLEFTDDGYHANVRTIPANTPVTVKFTFPRALIGLADGVSLGIFRNLNAVAADWPLGGLLGAGHEAGYEASYQSELYSGSTLLNLLNGAGEVEITLTPTEAYQGVYLKLEGNALSLDLSNNLFHAYIMEGATLACDEKDEAIDVLTGIRAGTVSLANATGSVTNPWNIIDGDPTTFAVLNTGAQVLSEVFHTTVFQTASRPNQVVQVVLQSPGGGLLDLGLLNGLVIQPYLGLTPVGDNINESNLLSLRLLPGTSDIFALTVPVSGSFDRIEIKMGGVASALETLRIYEVSRLSELPQVNGSNAEGKILTCFGSSAILIATAPNGNTINWYTTPENGTPITTGVSGGTLTTPPITGPVTYYVSSQPTGCTTESPRVPVTVDIIPLPSITISPALTACEGDNIFNIEFIDPIGNPTDYSIEWDNAPEDFEDVDWVESTSTLASPIEVSIPATTLMGEYKGILKVRNENCESDNISFTLKILPLPGKPHLTITDVYN